ncbi:MAG TPA: baseplate J/gp47 family protein [Ktedonobacteraceae bacterium]|nr:baseplate J/gp47 family protein [Ktedonobacteraceae bacterium]
MLTGELPYNDPDDIEVIKQHLHAPVPNPCTRDASIPGELGAVVERAMAKRAELRFPDVTDFRRAFLAAIEGPGAPRVDEAFGIEPEEDFEVYELPLRPAPAPIEFPDPELPGPRHPHRVIENEAMPPPVQRRSRPAREDEETLQLGPRRQRITGERADLPAAHTPRSARDTDEAQAGVRRPRVTDDDESLQQHPGRAGVRSRETTRPEGRPVRMSAESPESVSRSRAPRRTQSGRLAHDKQAVSIRQPLQSGQLASDKQALGARARVQGGSGGLVLGARARVQNEQSVPDKLAAPLPTRARRRGKRARFALVGAIVPVVLILLLLLPRALGLSIFPSGFPLFGASPVTTITLSVKTRAVSDTFLLTASPQVAHVDGNTRVIPARGAHGSANGSRSVATTGLKGTPGTHATGILLFSNSGPVPVTISSGFTFTASGGVQVRLTRSTVVPARVDGKNGKVSAPGIAVTPGQEGNIPPGALDALCCGGLVIVSNPAAFSGGNDTGVVHLVTQNDLDGVRDELAPALQQKALQQIDGQLASNEVRAGTPGYHISVSSDHPVGSQATQVNVTVTVGATVLIYNPQVAGDLARQLLNKEAVQTIGPDYQPRDGLRISPATVEQQSNEGHLYLSIAASGLWAYHVTPLMEQQWRQAIRGATITLAQSYLTTRPGITVASISLPFGQDHLPTDDKQLVFVVK